MGKTREDVEGKVQTDQALEFGDKIVAGKKKKNTTKIREKRKEKNGKLANSTLELECVGGERMREEKGSEGEEKRSKRDFLSGEFGRAGKGSG